MRFEKACPTGNSMDSIEAPQSTRCIDCNGDGVIETGVILFNEEIEKEICTTCGGSGRISK